MKKHNSILCIAALCVLFLVLYTVSCKTVPAAPAADMFTLFDSDADLYLRIPVRSNEAFVSALVRAWLPSLDARSLQKLMKRTSVLYAAFFVQQKDRCRDESRGRDRDGDLHQRRGEQYEGAAEADVRPFLRLDEAAALFAAG